MLERHLRQDFDLVLYGNKAIRTHSWASAIHLLVLREKYQERR